MQRWQKWLCGMKKDEEKRKEREHQQLVSRMITSAEEGASFLRIRRFEEEEFKYQMVKKRMTDPWPDVKRREKNGPSIGSATPRLRTYRTSRGEMRISQNLGGGLPRLIERNLREGSEELQGKDRSGMLSRQKSLWILSKKMREQSWKFLEHVEQRGRWPQQACTTMTLLDT